MRRPRAKVARFLLSDGPVATYRKARTKLGERKYQGDYRVAAVVGTVAGTTTRVAGLACRMPPRADYLLVHRDLLRHVDDDFDLDAFANTLADDLALLERDGRQTYLFSGEEPPAELLASVDRAAAGAARLPASVKVVQRPLTTLAVRPPAGDGIPLALLGAGDYARTEIIPRLGPEVIRYVVADREPNVAALAARDHGFAFAETDPAAAVRSLPKQGIVYVATSHDTHARLAAAALERGHRVFLEKPAVVTEEDLDLLLDAILTTGGILEVGFNRRWNPLVQELRRALAREAGPTTVTAIVKEVSLERDHWYLWPNQGTRVTGNLCHWLDLGVFLLGAGAIPTDVTVSPAVNTARESLDEDRVVAVGFDDGSLVTVVATGRGDDLRGVQERLDARRSFTSASLEDLWRLTVRREGRTHRRRTAFRDKGHGRMFEDAYARLRRGDPAHYPLADLVRVSLVQLEASRLVRENETHAAIGDRVRSWLQRLDTVSRTAEVAR